MQARWEDADQSIDKKGNVLDIQEYDEMVYGPEYFEYGDIWHQARWKKPLDMSGRDLELCMDLVQKMVQLKPDLRLSTAELLQHDWLKNT